MLRSIYRNVRLPLRVESRHLFSKKIARATVNPIKPYRFQPLALTWQHGFHTFTPLFDQQQQKPTSVEHAEEEEVDPNHKMLIGFTCKVCQDRSHHVMSKHSYTKGVVLIQCPGCKNRHLIADNLGWFRDSKTTVEDLVKEKGEAIRHIMVDEQGVEKMGDLMEWLPDIAEEEKKKKAEAKAKAEELKATQKKTEEEQ